MQINKISNVSFSSNRLSNVRNRAKIATFVSIACIAAGCLNGNKQAAKCEEQTTPTDTLKTAVDTTQKGMPSQYYIVQNGDNLWNIAKKRLQEQGQNPTDPQIYKEVHRTMDINNLCYQYGIEAGWTLVDENGKFLQDYSPKALNKLIKDGIISKDDPFLIDNGTVMLHKGDTIFFENAKK